MGVPRPIDWAAGPIVAVAAEEDPIVGYVEEEGAVGMHWAVVRHTGRDTERPSTVVVCSAAAGRGSRGRDEPSQMSRSIPLASPCLSQGACRRLACWADVMEIRRSCGGGKPNVA